ncbi:MAG: thioredoxin family protein [Halobacteriota archaeon]
MVRKWMVIIMVLMVLPSLSIAGCVSSTNNNRAATNASTQAATNSSIAPSVVPSPSAGQPPISTLIPTPTPSAYSTPTASQAPNGGGSASLTVLYFYDPNCPHCQALAPQVTQLQNNYAGRVPVQWIINNQSQLTGQYGVSTVPTLILLNNGNEAGRWVGATDTSGISAQIDSLLGTS